MPIDLGPEWQQLLLYAAGAAIVLLLIFRIPFIGGILRGIFSIALLVLGLFLLFQHAPYDPNLSRLSSSLGLDRQEVFGSEVRIPMSRDGHFWGRVSINGVERRMLIDSGATITAISTQTAQDAGVETVASVTPIMLRTAGGVIQAEAATVDQLDLGGIEARGIKVVVSPAFQSIDVLGMNFLSRLQSWRVEGRTLILVPEAGDDEGAPPVN